jgi:hypothetical protein
MYSSGPICILGLIASSFALTLPTLILTQGALYGTGFILFYYPILSMVNEFWIARRGFAYGLLCSASGVSGAAMPFAVEKLLERYGYQTTLRAVAVGLCVVTGPLIPLLRPRLPERGAGVAARTDWGFLRSEMFWTYSLSNFAMGMGYFFPALYIPSYALASGLSSTQGALLLALMAVSQVVGQTSFGYLSDRRVSINLLAGSSSVVAAVAVYACWGLARSFGVLIAFSLIYGFFGAGYTALWVSQTYFETIPRCKEGMLTLPPRAEWAPQSAATPPQHSQLSDFSTSAKALAMYCLDPSAAYF